MAKVVQNPWLNISWNNTIADCDKKHIVKIGKKDFVFGSSQYVAEINKKDKTSKRPIALTFDCLPDPFCGDPNSKVYCLNMNPGKPDKVFCQGNDHQDKYLDYARDMLNHKVKEPGLLNCKEKGIIYDPNSYEGILNDICNDKDKKEKLRNEEYDIRPHGGAIWQRDMRRALIGAIGHDPNIFDIEYFPYHSTSGFKFPTDLPSYQYRNYLIKKAMDDHKLIIIMRMRDEWYKIEENDYNNGLGPRLKRYQNKVFLKNPQRVWLTPGNFCWEIPESGSSIPYAESWACHCVKDIINMF